MTRSLLSLYASALLLCGCSETVTHYEADATGGWRKIASLPGYRANGATYIINGLGFQYNFGAIGGSAEIRGEGSTHLAPGEYKRAFYKLQGAPLLSTRRARQLAGSIAKSWVGNLVLVRRR